jgi:hypothetical protein
MHYIEKNMGDENVYGRMECTRVATSFLLGFSTPKHPKVRSDNVTSLEISLKYDNTVQQFSK